MQGGPSQLRRSLDEYVEGPHRAGHFQRVGASCGREAETRTTGRLLRASHGRILNWETALSGLTCRRSLGCMVKDAWREVRQARVPLSVTSSHTPSGPAQTSFMITEHSAKCK